MWSIPVDKKLVLCVSGGGVRGAIVTQLLENLEKELGRPLSEVFDLFVGTSTGGVIVSGIAHEEMSASELNEDFYNSKILSSMMKKTLLDQFFGLFQFRPKYNNKAKREVIKNLVGDKDFYDTDKNVMITCYDVTERKPVLFKSWQKEEDDMKLASVLDVTSAACGYFPSVEYKKGHWGIDGAVFANNPSECAYVEALKLFGKDADIRILSIGTGHGMGNPIGKESEKFGSIQWAAKGDLINTFIDAPLKSSEYRLKKETELMEHTYLHIQGSINNTSLDNSSPQNLKALKIQGDMWWKEYKDDILNCITK